MKSQIRADVVEFVVNNYLFGDDDALPADNDSLVESGVVDSTGILELIEFLESRFGIEVAEHETVPANLGSVANLVGFVTAKQAAHDG